VRYITSERVAFLDFYDKPNIYISPVHQFQNHTYFIHPTSKYIHHPSPFLTFSFHVSYVDLHCRRRRRNRTRHRNWRKHRYTPRISTSSYKSRSAFKTHGTHPSASAADHQESPGIPLLERERRWETGDEGQQLVIRVLVVDECELGIWGRRTEATCWCGCICVSLYEEVGGFWGEDVRKPPGKPGKPPVGAAVREC
jgi:hypothetical protein